MSNAKISIERHVKEIGIGSVVEGINQTLLHLLVTDYPPDGSKFSGVVLYSANPINVIGRYHSGWDKDSFTLSKDIEIKIKC